MTLEERLKAIEDRLDKLEHYPEPRARKADFWAINYLEEHAPESGGVVYAGVVNIESIGNYAWQTGLPSEQVLQQPWSEASQALTALAHPVRLEILKMILQGKHTSQELQELQGLGTTGQLYHHLKELQSAGWLKVESRGNYKVVPERIIPLMAIVLAGLGNNIE
jgi:DNA-binding transcriptional ArsR family regulator